MRRIVRASRKHIGAIANLMVASPLLRPYGATARGVRAGLARGFREHDTLFVALDGDAVVGLAWFIQTPALDHATYLQLLLVAESHQSRGLGALFLARGERHARASGSGHMVMLVTKTNLRARAFYERHGYAYVGDLPGFVRPEITETLYQKSLSRSVASRPAASTRHAVRPARPTSSPGRGRAR
jgi:ribosomal protein S18 acetylase RimI-like enzyme